jgi:hypothetical protein
MQFLIYTRAARLRCRRIKWICATIPAAENPSGDTTIEQAGNDDVPREIPQIRRILRWVLIAALAALISYFSFRSYLDPELLFNFANSFTC